MQSLNNTDRPALQGEHIASHRVEVMKELTLVLLKQLEALGENQSPNPTRNINLYEEVRRFESDLIRYALMRAGGSQRRAARLLGVKVTTLNAKIKRNNIQMDVLVGNTNESRPEDEGNELDQM